MNGFADALAGMMCRRAMAVVVPVLLLTIGATYWLASWRYRSQIDEAYISGYAAGHTDARGYRLWNSDGTPSESDSIDIKRRAEAIERLPGFLKSTVRYGPLRAPSYRQPPPPPDEYDIPPPPAPYTPEDEESEAMESLLISRKDDYGGKRSIYVTLTATEVEELDKKPKEFTSVSGTDARPRYLMPVSMYLTLRGPAA